MVRLIRIFFLLSLISPLLSCTEDESGSVVSFSVSEDSPRPLVIYAPFPRLIDDGFGLVFTELVDGPWFTVRGTIGNDAFLDEAETEPNTNYIQILAMTFEGTSTVGGSRFEAFPRFIGEPSNMDPSLNTGNDTAGESGDGCDDITNNLSSICEADYVRHQSRVRIGDVEAGTFAPLILRPGDEVTFDITLFSIAGMLGENMDEGDLEGSTFTYQVRLQGILLDENRLETGSFSRMLTFTTRN